MKVIIKHWYRDNQDWESQTTRFENVKNITTYRDNENQLWLLITFKENTEESEHFKDGMTYVEYDPENDAWGVEL